jgi:hypothetical protein
MRDTVERELVPFQMDTSVELPSSRLDTTTAQVSSATPILIVAACVPSHGAEHVCFANPMQGRLNAHRANLCLLQQPFFGRKLGVFGVPTS